MKPLANEAGRFRRSFAAFTAKELTESLRTKRVLVLVCVFISLALLSVLTARFMGEIFAALLSIEGGAPFVIEIPPPVWTDSYMQLYGNLTQMGIITIILLYMSVILREKRTGTIDLMFAKGLTPGAFVLSKYAVAAVIMLLTLFVTVFVTFGYTLVLFEYAGNIGDVMLGAVAFGVFLLMMLAITFLCSAVAKSTAVSAVLGLASFFVLMLVGALPVVGRFVPFGLVGYGFNLAAGGGQERMGMYVAIAVAVAALCLWLAAHVLRKREG